MCNSPHGETITWFSSTAPRWLRCWAAVSLFWSEQKSRLNFMAHKNFGSMSRKACYGESDLPSADFHIAEQNWQFIIWWESWNWSIVQCKYFVSFHLSSFQQIEARTKVWEWNARLDFCWSRNPIHPGRLVAAINISVAQRKYKCEGEKLKTWQQESWLRKSRIGTGQVECWFGIMEQDAAWEMLQLRTWSLKVSVWEYWESRIREMKIR